MSSTPPVEPAYRRRSFSTFLIAALGLIVLMASAVVVVDTISARDKAGGSSTTPDIAELAGPLAEQELSWEECSFDEGAAAPPPNTDISNVECATIKVPRDWHAPNPEVTWDLRISLATNIDSADPDYHTTVIAHPGGPYTAGLAFGAIVQSQTPELRPTTNYVSYDQRGLGQSSHAECEYEYDPADGAVAQVQAIGEACSTDPEVATMTTEQTAYDMDFIRHLLDVDTVTYMGYSYGTWLGTWYGSIFGENIERMIFDSSLDTTKPSIQTLYDAAHEGRDRQFRLHMMNWVARQDATYDLGTDPETIWTRYFAATESPDATVMARYVWNVTGAPIAFSHSAAYPLAGELIAAIISEGERTGGVTDPVAAAARIVEGMESLSDEQRGAALTQLEVFSSPPPGVPGETIQATYSEVIDFTKCTDGQWVQGVEHWEEFNQATAEVAPLSAQLGLLDTPQTCAFWPTDSTKPEVESDFPETLVLQNELDSMTPYEQGHAAGTGLPNASLIVVDNENAHGVFPYGTDEVDRPVIDFLLGGDRPAETIVAAGKPMPMDDVTYESWSPLTESGEHEGEAPAFTNPTVPARTAELSTP